MPTTVDEYIATFPDEVRARLTEIRRHIHAAVPAVTESLRYGMAAFTVDGQLLVHLAGWKRHIALYPLPAGDEEFETAVAPYRDARSTARFPLNQPVPYELIDQIVRRLAESRLS
jgi:uncharacterized protein YdhG (YjbR/CyaY superfamily)